GHVHRLVELGVRRALHPLHRVAGRIQLARLQRPDRRAVALAMHAHQSSTSRPIERAVPATIFIAASISLAFRSGIFSSAILRTWARVTFPTFWRFEVGLPFSMPASFLGPRSPGASWWSTFTSGP